MKTIIEHSTRSNYNTDISLATMTLLWHNSKFKSNVTDMSLVMMTLTCDNNTPTGIYNFDTDLPRELNYKFIDYQCTMKLIANSEHLLHKHVKSWMILMVSKCVKFAILLVLI